MTTPAITPATTLFSASAVCHSPVLEQGQNAVAQRAAVRFGSNPEGADGASGAEGVGDAGDQVDIDAAKNVDTEQAEETENNKKKSWFSRAIGWVVKAVMLIALALVALLLIRQRGGKDEAPAVVVANQNNAEPYTKENFLQRQQEELDAQVENDLLTKDDDGGGPGEIVYTDLTGRLSYTLEAHELTRRVYKDNGDKLVHEFNFDNTGTDPVLSSTRVFYDKNGAEQTRRTVKYKLLSDPEKGFVPGEIITDDNPTVGGPDPALELHESAMVLPPQFDLSQLEAASLSN